VRGVVDYRLLTNIYATNNLAGIVISVKILGLKFLRYIAEIKSALNTKRQSQMTLPFYLLQVI